MTNLVLQPHRGKKIVYYDVNKSDLKRELEDMSDWAEFKNVKALIKGLEEDSNYAQKLFYKLEKDNFKYFSLYFKNILAYRQRHHIARLIIAYRTGLRSAGYKIRGLHFCYD